jgi:hypothetical protein
VGCNAILDGYVRCLREGGQPIVLAEREQKLGKLGVDSFKTPSNFWEKLEKLPVIRHKLAKDLKRALEQTLPDAGIKYKVVIREAGLGSLGQERFVAIGRWQGGCIAREAKRMIPSACSWLNEQIGHRQSLHEKAITSAVRSPAPFQSIDGPWLIRRLSPDSNPIDIQFLPKHSDEEMLLCAMGTEAANSPGNERSVKADFERPATEKARLAAKGRHSNGKDSRKGLESIQKKLRWKIAIFRWTFLSFMQPELSNDAD